MSEQKKQEELIELLRKTLKLEPHQHFLDDLIGNVTDALLEAGYSRGTEWEEGVAPLDTQLRYSLLEDSETPKDYAVNEIVEDVRRANIMTDLPYMHSGFGALKERWVDTEQHYVVLDIDHPTQLIPSSTPGHFHLIIEKLVPKYEWIKVLLALSDAGIVQPGYAYASIKAGYTSIRLPWVRKGFKTDQPLDGHPTDLDGNAVKTWEEHERLRVQNNPLKAAQRSIDKKKKDMPF